MIAVVGATDVLYVDAATFLLSGLALALLVPRRPPLAASDEGKGLLAGVRFIARDRLLAPLGVTSLFLNMFGRMLAASLPVLAYVEYGGSSRVAGAFFGAFVRSSSLWAALIYERVSSFAPLRSSEKEHPLG